MAHALPWSLSGIDACDLVRQRRASPFPHPDSRLVDRLHQAPDVELPKPTAEVPGRRGVRDRSSTERVQVREVVATQLDVVEGPPAAHHVVGNVQDVLGLKVGSVMLEQREVLVDALTEPDAIERVSEMKWEIGGRLGERRGPEGCPAESARSVEQGGRVPPPTLERDRRRFARRSDDGGCRRRGADAGGPARRDGGTVSLTARLVRRARTRAAVREARAVEAAWRRGAASQLGLQVRPAVGGLRSLGCLRAQRIASATP